MKYDIMVGGVGGQGILSIAYVIDNAAMNEGLHFKQSEVHGMAQRGGAVSSHLRLSDQVIFSDLVSNGGAQMLLSVEPMEALRYRHFLAPDGVLVVSTCPMVNIPAYPERETLLAELATFPRMVLVDADKLAKDAGTPRASNMVMVGVASQFLPLKLETLRDYIQVLFEPKGERVQQLNLTAFEYGREAGLFFAQCREAGANLQALVDLMAHFQSQSLSAGSAGVWAKVLTRADLVEALGHLWLEQKDLAISASASTATRVLDEGIAFLGAPA